MKDLIEASAAIIGSGLLIYVMLYVVDLTVRAAKAIK